MSFDLSRSQRCFVMGMWLGSAVISLALIAYDAVTGRNR